MLSRVALKRGAALKSSFSTVTTARRFSPLSSMRTSRTATRAPRRFYSNEAAAAETSQAKPASSISTSTQGQVPMIEYCGMMIPDVKIPERVVDSIVEKLTGGMDNPLLSEFYKLKNMDTESLANFFTNSMSQYKPQPYQSRYPDVSVDSVLKKFDELYSKKIYTYDDRFKYYFMHGLGHSEQEYDEIILGKTPKLILEDGSIDFQEVSRYLGSNREFTRRWKHIESIFNQLDELSKRQVKLEMIDWDFWEEQLGSDVVQVTKETLDSAIREIPIFPVELALDSNKIYFEPYMNMLKDEVLDELPYLEKMVDEEVKMGELMERLEREGDIGIDELLGEYFPEVQNEIDLEIENENWDYEYQDEIRAILEGKTMSDFIITRNEFHEFIEYKWNEVIQSNQRSQASGTTPLESAMKELARAQDNLKRIETELSTMKGKDDSHDEHSGDGAGADAAAAAQDEAMGAGKEIEKSPFQAVVQSYITKLYNLEPDYWQKFEIREREAREKAAAEKAAAEKAATEQAEAVTKKK